MARKSPFSAIPLLAAVVLVGLSLTGCTTFNKGDESETISEGAGEKMLPPPGAGAPATPEPATSGAANTGGTYPYGSVPSEGEAGTTEKDIVVTDPQGKVLDQQAPDPARQEAVDACYQYARAQIAHDVQMESDAAASMDQYSQGLGLTELRGRMQAFAQDSRLRELFQSCMNSRGYHPE
jgi:hypothetical protein